MLETPPVAGGLYDVGFYDAASGRLEPIVEILRRLADAEQARLLRDLPPRARVLDVGAGDGRLLARLAAADHDVEGIEPSSSHAERARAAAGVRVHALPLERVELPQGGFDAAVMWHVLEHVADPAAALARVRTWLRPGGVAVVATPNLASFQALIGGDRWFHQDVPRHLSLFTPEGLRLLLERSGFRIATLTTRTLDQTLLGMSLTLLNRGTREPNALFRFVRRRRVSPRDLLTGVAAAPLVVPLALAAELAALAANRGGVVVARAFADGRP